MRDLKSRVVLVESLTVDQITSMICLMKESYEGITKYDFTNDLKNKQFCLLIEDKDCVCGFTTIETFQMHWKKSIIDVVFSGDTVIKKEYRNTNILWLSFGKWMLTYSKNKDLYWFLISKSYRTYRYLTQNFNHFFPSISAQDSNLKGIATALAKTKYPNQYSEKENVIKSDARKQYLKITEQPKIKFSKQESFYYNLNPGYVNGDELVCVVPYSQENLKERVLNKFTRSVASLL